MVQHSEKPAKNTAPSRRTEAAFDVWLQSGLHQMYDDVAHEPVPEDLLKLLQDDHRK